VNLQAHYNIAPTDTVDVVAMRDGKVELARMPWGLVPWWWKKPMKQLPSTFNARAETVATKPMFRDAFEWQPTPTRKQPTTSRRQTGRCSRSGIDHPVPLEHGPR
jgi:hypothetical protein